MSTETLIILTLAFVAVFAYRNHLPKKYRRRNCQGFAWRPKFPSASKQEIRRFLALVTENFAFEPSEGLRFNPEDTFSDIYRSLYPFPGSPDCLEVEGLGADIEREYNILLVDQWPRFSLGDLFGIVRDW